MLILIGGVIYNFYDVSECKNMEWELVDKEWFVWYCLVEFEGVLVNMW